METSQLLPFLYLGKPFSLDYREVKQGECSSSGLQQCLQSKPWVISCRQGRDVKKEKKKRKSHFVSVMPASITLSFSSRITETQMLGLGEVWFNNSVLIYTQWALCQRCCLIGETNMSISLTPKVYKPLTFLKTLSMEKKTKNPTWVIHCSIRNLLLLNHKKIKIFA